MRVFGTAILVIAALACASVANAEPPLVNAAPASEQSPPAPATGTAATPSVKPVTPELINSNSEPETPAGTPVNASEAAAAPTPTPTPTPDATPSAGAVVVSPSAVTAPVAPATEAAAAPPAPPPEPTLAIDINLTSQRMTVSEYGKNKYTWAISSAAAGYRTPTGTFSPAWMSRMWYSRQYDLAPMPHAIFFHRGVAIHATNATRMLGRPASHGCVRLAPSNAATLYRMVGQHGNALTRIVVHGTPKHPPAIAHGPDSRRQIAARRNAYWMNYSYYAPPSYPYGAPPRSKRRVAARPYYYPPPRRYVSRGLFQPGY